MLGRLDISTSGTQRGQSPVLQVNEGEAFKVILRPLSEDLAATTPTTIRYRIDDLKRGDAILDWTSLTPGTTVTLIVTGAQNAIRGSGTERKQLVAEATDSDGSLRRTLEWDVLDLQGIT